MKTAAFIVFLSQVAAFTPMAAPKRSFITLNDKINTKIDLDSPKVVNTEEVNAGEKKVFCRCWQSGTFPLCDAAHVAHNKETGDNVGPLIVSAPKTE